MQNILSLTYEYKRLKALLSYQILDTPSETEFENLVNTAAQIFNVPAAAVTFIDENRQWIKASTGLEVCTTERKDAVCNYTIRQDAINEIEDMRADERYNNLPYVAGEPFYRFYAGVPLITEKNFRIGAFCILDTQPRILNDEERSLLTTFAKVAMAQVEISLRNKEMERLHQVQNRILHLMNQDAKDANAPTPQTTGLQQERRGHFLSTDDLLAMDELLKKQVVHTIGLLDEKIEWKKKELQNAINRIQNDRLKQIVNTVLNDTDLNSLQK